MLSSRLRLLAGFGLRPAIWVTGAALLVCGCGSSNLVPVSGTVTLVSPPRK